MKPSRQVNTLLLRYHLKALRLLTVSAECEKAAKQCNAQGIDHLGYLFRACKLELIERERKAAAQRLKAAKFPAVKTATESDFAASPAINRSLILESLKCEFLFGINSRSCICWFSMNWAMRRPATSELSCFSM